MIPLSCRSNLAGRYLKHEENQRLHWTLTKENQFPTKKKCIRDTYKKNTCTQLYKQFRIYVQNYKLNKFLENSKTDLTNVGHILHVGIGEEAGPPGADIGGCAVEGDRGAEPARDPQVGDGGRQGRPQAGHPVTHLHIFNRLPNKGPKNDKFKYACPVHYETLKYQWAREEKMKYFSQVFIGFNKGQNNYKETKP